MLKNYRRKRNPGLFQGKDKDHRQLNQRRSKSKHQNLKPGCQVKDQRLAKKRRSKSLIEAVASGQGR